MGWELGVLGLEKPRIPPSRRNQEKEMTYLPILQSQYTLLYDQLMHASQWLGSFSILTKVIWPWRQEITHPGEHPTPHPHSWSGRCQASTLVTGSTLRRTLWIINPGKWWQQRGGGVGRPALCHLLPVCPLPATPAEVPSSPSSHLLHPLQLPNFGNSPPKSSFLLASFSLLLFRKGVSYYLSMKGWLASIK